VTLVAGVVFIAVYTLFAYQALPLTYAVLPALILLQIGAMLGAAFALSAIGAFFRDLGDLVQLAGIVLIFLMPIVYIPDTVPDVLEAAVWANPFSYMVWCYQDLLYFGRFEHPFAWVIFVVWTFVLLLVGYRLFRRLRPYYANVV
jgi:lipopolysaccharide transport system permease protein